MKRLKMIGIGLLMVLSGVFLLSGCSNSPEAKLADLFEGDQVYYLANSPLDQPRFTIEKSSEGKVTAYSIKGGISEELDYSVEKKGDGLYQYHIENAEGKAIFELLGGYSDTTDFKAFYDQKHEGYAFVPVSKNYAKADSTLNEVKAIYEDDPMYFVSMYEEK
ncbi:hypothetical protein [Enterococcus sp. AZ149]|uniref:hypothetical protein n=1 Tax=Enterococcus sp. AZ149 TaxID=2774686 RepID=UPI003F26D560